MSNLYTATKTMDVLSVLRASKDDESVKEFCLNSNQGHQYYDVIAKFVSNPNMLTGARGVTLQDLIKCHDDPDDVVKKQLKGLFYGSKGFVQLGFLVPTENRTYTWGRLQPAQDDLGDVDPGTVTEKLVYAEALCPSAPPNPPIPLVVRLFDNQVEMMKDGDTWYKHLLPSWKSPQNTRLGNILYNAAIEDAAFMEDVRLAARWQACNYNRQLTLEGKPIALGPIAGVISRLASGLNKRKKAKLSGSHMDLYRVLKKYLPIKSPGEFGDWMEGMTITSDSDAGLMFLHKGKMRKKVPRVSMVGRNENPCEISFREIVDHANALLEELAKVGNLTSYIKRNPGFTWVGLKSKFEKKDVTKLPPKDRPYGVFNAHATLIGSRFMKFIMQSWGFFLDSPDSINAVGFSYAHNGAKKLHEWAQETTRNAPRMALYGDDMYIAVRLANGEVWVFAPDIVQCDLSLGMFTEFFEFYFAQVGRDMFDEKNVWRRVGSDMLPLFFSTNLAIYGSLAVKFHRNGVLSGMPGTTQCDMIAGAVLWSQGRSLFRQLTTRESLDKAIADFTALAAKMNLTLKKSTLTPFLHNEEGCGATFLGYSIAKIDGHFVPFMPRLDVLTSLFAYKEPLAPTKASNEYRTVLRNSYGLVSSLGVMLSSGFAHKDVYLAVKGYWTSLLAQGVKPNFDLLSEVDVMLGMDNIQTYANYFFKEKRVPSRAQMMLLYTTDRVDPKMFDDSTPGDVKTDSGEDYELAFSDEESVAPDAHSDESTVEEVVELDTRLSDDESPALNTELEQELASLRVMGEKPIAVTLEGYEFELTNRAVAASSTTQKFIPREKGKSAGNPSETPEGRAARMNMEANKKTKKQHDSRNEAARGGRGGSSRHSNKTGRDKRRVEYDEYDENNHRSGDGDHQSD